MVFFPLKKIFEKEIEIATSWHYVNVNFSSDQESIYGSVFIFRQVVVFMYTFCDRVYKLKYFNNAINCHKAVKIALGFIYVFFLQVAAHCKARAVSVYQHKASRMAGKLWTLGLKVNKCISWFDVLDILIEIDDIQRITMWRKMQSVHNGRFLQSIHSIRSTD